MSEYNLGTAKGTIEIDYKGNGVTQAQQGLKQTSKAAETSDQALRKTGTGALVAGTAIVAGLGLAIKSAASFEKGLSGIQAVSGATTQEMDVVRKKALQLGADTAFSATDAASAMEELVKAGISIPDVMNGAADATVALAAAGGVALPEAATIASNAMNQFGLSSKEMPKIADAIAGAANASAIDVSEFGMSLSQVGAVANLAGLNFQDTAVAIAEMGNAGIKGSDAGTSLKTMLSNLIPTTDQQIAKFRELGLLAVGDADSMKRLAERGIKPVSSSYSDVSAAISKYIQDSGGAKVGTAKNNKATQELGTELGALKNQFFDASGKVKSMAQIQELLHKSTKDLTSEQKQAALGVLFGSDAIRAAAVLSKNGAAGYDKLAKSMNSVKAADVAATRMKNLDGQVEQLKGSAETLAIGLGTVLIPSITGIAKHLTEVVNWFSQLGGGTQKALVLVVAFAGGVLLMVGALIKLVEFAKAAQATMILLNGTFLANPIFLIIAGIVLLVAAIVLLWKNSETFRKIVTAAWEGVKSAVMAVAGWFTGTLVPWFQKVWASITGGASSLWASLTAIWNSIKTSVATVWGGIAAVFSAVWSGIVMVVTTYINIVRTIITSVLNVIMAVWRAVWGVFGPLVKAVWSLITAIIEVALAWIKVGISAALNFIKGVWTATWNAVKSVAAKVWGGIKDVIGKVLGGIRAVITTYVNLYRAVITAVWNAIKAVISGVMNAIRAVINAVWGAIGGTVMAAVNRIRTTVTTAFNAVKSTVTSIWGALTGIISRALASAHSAVTSAVNSIKGVFTGAGTWLYDSGKKLIQGLIDGIKSMVGAAAKAISGVADKIRGFLPGSPIKEGPLKDHGWNQGNPGKKLVGLVASGVESDIGRIAQAFSGLSPELPSTLTSSTVALAASDSRTGSSRSFSSAAPSQSAPMFGEGAIQVTAPQNMSPEQVGTAVASKVVHRVTTGATAVPMPVRSR